MELKQAIWILETHNRWRRNEDVEPMLAPRDIGIAIDIVVEYVKNNVVSVDVIKCDNPHCDDGLVEFIYGEPLRCSNCDDK